MGPHRAGVQSGRMAMDVVVIRRGGEADKPALKAILKDTFDSTRRPNITPAAVERYLISGVADRFIDEHGLECLVAEIDGEVAGFIRWEGDFIDALHVHSRHARKGLGQRLMEGAEAAIVAAGFAQVRLETDTFNETSQAFYRSRGYREAGRYPDEEWQSGLTTILFVKP